MKSIQQYPTRTHIYQHHMLDSTRWDRYMPRDDDIIITTSYKSGTTWTQAIVRELIVASYEKSVATDPSQLPLPDDQSSAWIEFIRYDTVDEIYEKIETQPHRRFLKTHLPLNGLPYFPQVRYLIVGRDPRDVFMSLWNHYHNYTEHVYQLANKRAELLGAPFPRAPENIHEFWAEWINRGWFEWEEEGYPFWGNMYHTQSYWRYRHLDNFFFVHYHDLLTDTASEIQRIADFLEIAVTEQAIRTIIAETSLDTMKQRAIEQDKKRTHPDIWRGGRKTFFHKGSNRRWQSVLTDTELAMYEATKAKVLTPSCAQWLEQGRVALQQTV